MPISSSTRPKPARHAITIDGAPAGTTGVEHAVVIDAATMFGDVLDLDGNDACTVDLAFTTARLTVSRGITDLGVVDSAHGSLAGAEPANALPDVGSFACDGDCAGNTADLTLPVGADALAYMASSALVVGIRMTGTPPLDPWTMELGVCVRARVNYRVGL